MIVNDHLGWNRKWLYNRDCLWSTIISNHYQPFIPITILIIIIHYLSFIIYHRSLLVCHFSFHCQHHYTGGEPSLLFIMRNHHCSRFENRFQPSLSTAPSINNRSDDMMLTSISIYFKPYNSSFTTIDIWWSDDATTPFSTTASSSFNWLVYRKKYQESIIDDGE